jgi:hypothetical protein
MKKAKSVLTVAALALGLGLGFGVAFTPAQAQAQAPEGLVECTVNAHCEYSCDVEGTGVCLRGRCVCP